MRAWYRYVGAAGAVALTLAACGGDDDSEAVAEPAAEPSAEPTAEPGSEPAPEGEMTTVKYLQATESLTFATLNYARSMGYFEDEGLELDVLPTLANSSQVVQVLESGEADIVATGSTAVVAAVGAGRDVTSIAVATKGATHGISMTNEWIDEVAERLDVTAESSVEDRMRALEGATLSLAGAGSTTDVMFRANLEAFGLDPESDVELRYINDQPAVVAAAREGQVDGMVVALPERALPVAEGWGEIWIDYPRGDVPPLDSFALIDVAMTNSFLSEHPDIADSFVRAMWRATDDFNNDPDGVRAVLRENWFSEMDEAVFDLSFERVLPLFADGPAPTPEAFEATVELYNVSAEDPVDLEFSDVYDPEPATRTQP